MVIREHLREVMCPDCSNKFVFNPNKGIVQTTKCSDCGRVYRITQGSEGYLSFEEIQESETVKESSEHPGRKNDTGKPPISLLDRDFIEGTANVMAFGAKKYDRYNWCGGIQHTRLVDAAMRHLVAYASGEDLDPESGLPHVDHAAASINMLRGNQRLHPELDDRYKK